MHSPEEERELRTLACLLNNPGYTVDSSTLRQAGGHLGSTSGRRPYISYDTIRTLLWESLGTEVDWDGAVASELDDIIYLAMTTEDSTVFYYGPHYGESWNRQGMRIEEPPGLIIPAPFSAK